MKIDVKNDYMTGTLDESTLHIELIKLQQENKKLKKQLEYIRSGEYYNQLRFERDMLQNIVDTNGVPSEVYDYIECLRHNTKLLEEKQEVIDYLKGEIKQCEELIIKHKQSIKGIVNISDNNRHLILIKTLGIEKQTYQKILSKIEKR